MIALDWMTAVWTCRNMFCHILTWGTRNELGWNTCNQALWKEKWWVMRMWCYHLTPIWLLFEVSWKCCFIMVLKSHYSWRNHYVFIAFVIMHFFQQAVASHSVKSEVVCFLFFVSYLQRRQVSQWKVYMLSLMAKCVKGHISACWLDPFNISQLCSFCINGS